MMFLTDFTYRHFHALRGFPATARLLYTFTETKRYSGSIVWAFQILRGLSWVGLGFG